VANKICTFHLLKFVFVMVPFVGCMKRKRKPSQQDSLSHTAAGNMKVGC